MENISSFNLFKKMISTSNKVGISQNIFIKNLLLDTINKAYKANDNSCNLSDLHKSISSFTFIDRCARERRKHQQQKKKKLKQ